MKMAVQKNSDNPLREVLAVPLQKVKAGIIMASRHRIKRIRRFRLTLDMKKKLFIVFAVAIGLLVFLIFRIAYIQAANGKRYEKIILNQQESSSTTIPFRRGDIVDRKGTVMATSTDVYNVILDCSVLMNKTDYMEPTMEALKSCFDMDTDKIRTYAQSHKDAQYYVLAKKLPYDEVEKFQDLEKKNKNIKGIWFEKQYQREYPYDTLASAVIGFTTSGNEGMGGLESQYNSTLNGIDGRSYGYLNNDNTYEQQTEDPVDGNTIVSTIDVNIQSIVEEKIRNFASQFASNSNNTDGAQHIGFIVEDPDSGEILAMASYPSYSLKNPWDLSKFYTKKQLKKMSENDRLDALNKIWQNFCVSSTYEPGSTAKPMTVAAAIDSGAITGDETYYCGGSLTVEGTLIHCDNIYGHGTETVTGALRDSCNVSMMRIAFAMGIDTFCRYQHTFNLGLRTNIDLPGEPRTDSLIYNSSNMNKVDLATNSFGQTFNLTMLQMVSAYTSIVNGGRYYQPHMVKEIQDSEGNTVEEIQPTLLRRTISESTSDKLTTMLQAVVNSGTGQQAKIEGYSMCGKTGTAEKLPRDKKNYLVSFECSVPAKNPKVVCYCVIDQPRTSDQAHSSFPQSIVKNVLEEILPYMNIEKDEE